MTSMVANFYNGCSELFGIILDSLSRRPDVAKSIILQIKSSHSYFVIWGDGYGLRDGRLDEPTDKYPRARGLTLRLLAKIGQTLTQSNTSPLMHVAISILLTLKRTLADDIVRNRTAQSIPEIS